MKGKAVVCLACNKEFFPASLRFHQKICFDKNAYVQIPCEKCHKPIRAGLHGKHFQNCMGFGYAESPPPESKQQQEAGPIEVDGRVRCKTCSRGFAPSRIAKHQSVCKGKGVTMSKSTSVPVIRAVQRRPSIPRSRTRHGKRIALNIQTVESKFPSAEVEKTKKHPYDMILRERSNQSGWATVMANSKYSHDHLSNATSATNPLATNHHMILTRRF